MAVTITDKKRKGVIRGKQDTTPRCNVVTSNEKVFVGIDPSLRATGLIVIDQDQCIMEEKLIVTTKNESEEASMSHILDELSFIPNIVRLESVYLEAPYVGHPNNTLQLGAIHYMIRVLLYKNDIKYKTIPPKSLKVFHCGSGSVKKAGVLDAVEKTLGVRFEDHNLADAYGLARLALEEFQNENF